jgi:hypothetical protein
VADAACSEQTWQAIVRASAANSRSMTEPTSFTVNIRSDNSS